jgi:hypothetical protein
MTAFGSVMHRKKPGRTPRSPGPPSAPRGSRDSTYVVVLYMFTIVAQARLFPVSYEVLSEEQIIAIPRRTPTKQPRGDKDAVL